MHSHTGASRIWVDLDNSPHIPFFAPIIEQLERRGYAVTVTTRDCFQVVDLARLHHLRHRTIGRHFGKSRFFKVIGLGLRTLQLISAMRSERPDLAVSHGSRAQLVACRLLGIPSVVIIDYEFARGLQVIRPTWVMCPEIVARGNSPYRSGRVLTYPGIKEDVYAPRFTPDPAIMRDLGLKPDDIVITLRPPATEAHYHNPESEVLLDAVFEVLAAAPQAKVVLLPRNERQEVSIRRAFPKLFETRKVLVPGTVVDGLNLIWHSDLVISGGGTMNREATALGVPVYSIFRGRIGAVDRYLASAGRLVLLESVDDVRSKLVLTRRHRSPDAGIEPRGALSMIVDHLVGVLRTDKMYGGVQA
jgi:uncharacterized protein